MSNWDLTMVMAPYLDRHLVFPLLEFLAAKKMYDSNDLIKCKFEMLKKTNMVDYTIDVFKNIHGDEEVPESLKARRTQVVNDLNNLMTECEPILELLSSEDFMSDLEAMRDQKSLLAYLREKNFKMESMEAMYKLSKQKYECGMYQHVDHYIYFYLLIMPPSDKNYLSALWGRLACEILVLQNWDTVLEDFNRLREYIDGNTFNSHLQLLQQRAWLIHWGLYIFFNHPKGKDIIIDICLYKANYLNAIQTMCPHILRYLATAVIINRSRRSALKDLVKVIQQESYTYRDPITEFLEHLYVNFDFEGARQKLHECQVVVSRDFFLAQSLDEFVENARLMIFETFCRIHQCISIGMLAEKLNMNPAEAECWIVNLIRNARLDAKIDSKLGHVVMGTQPLSPYQQLLEKVDALSVRSEPLQTLIDRKLKAKNQDLARGYNQEFISIN